MSRCHSPTSSMARSGYLVIHGRTWGQKIGKLLTEIGKELGFSTLSDQCEGMLYRVDIDPIVHLVVADYCMFNASMFDADAWFGGESLGPTPDVG